MIWDEKTGKERKTGIVAVRVWHALYKGYDAYTYDQGSQLGYMVVLNRGKVAVAQ